ncbi:hypothetical protein M758_UG111700, partial [Ceratodon purpureus]
MDLPNSESYESMLCEDRDTEDKWWFLRALDIEVTSEGGVFERGRASDITSESPMADTEAMNRCVESCSELPRPSLGETELGMLDSFCVKYGGTAEFRADLIKLLLLLVSVQNVTGVNAHSGGMDFIDGF